MVYKQNEADMKPLKPACEKKNSSQNGVCLHLTLVMTGTYGNLEVCGSNYNMDLWLDEGAGS